LLLLVSLLSFGDQSNQKKFGVFIFHQYKITIA